MRTLIATLFIMAGAATLCSAQSRDTTTFSPRTVAPADTENLPAADEFVPVEWEATYNEADLQRAIHYPAEALNRGIQGTVILRVLIGRSGEIKNLIVDQHTDPLLDEAAINAVRETKFTPARNGNQPVATWKQVNVEFRLE